LPDTNFIAAFANNPLTLSILMIAVIIVVFIWKISPFCKDLLERVTQSNDSAENMRLRIECLLKSDAEQSNAIKEISEHMRCNTLDVLRITIYNEAIDIEDRLVAARRYFIKGGNGKVAVYVQGLVKNNPSIWRTILSMTKDDEKALLPEDLKEI
jgi:hypothetical protein